MTGIILGAGSATGTAARQAAIGDAELQLFTSEAVNELAAILQLVLEHQERDTDRDAAPGKDEDGWKSVADVYLERMDQSPIPKASQVIAAWDNALSNNMLEFREQNVVAKRPGSRSCYPVAFGKIVSPVTKCSVRIDEVTKQRNAAVSVTVK